MHAHAVHMILADVGYSPRSMPEANDKNADSVSIRASCVRQFL